MRDWIVLERSVTWLDDGFQIDFLPNTALKHFIPHRNPITNQVGIEVPGYVGVVGLNNGDRLRIEPKYPSSFMRLLADCNGIDLEKSGVVPLGTGDSDIPIKLLVRIFIDGLKIIRANGLMFEWEKERSISTYAMSNVDWASTAIRIKRLEDDPFEGKRTVRNFNTVESNVLSVASLTIANMVPEQMSELDKQMLSFFYKRANYKQLINDIRVVATRLSDDFYHGQRAYYAKTLRTALLILGFNGISFNSSFDALSDGFLVNSDDLFEEWVRVRIRHIFSEDRIPRLVQKERRNNKQFFIGKNYYLIPDVLIFQGAEIVGIGDAKNKTPSIDDFYQMCTYIEMYHLKKGFLISSDGTNGGSIEELRSREETNKSINIYHLDMSSMSKCDELIRKAVRWSAE